MVAIAPVWACLLTPLFYLYTSIYFQSESSLTISCKHQNKHRQMVALFLSVVCQVLLSFLLVITIFTERCGLLADLSSVRLPVPGLFLGVFWTLHPTCRIKHLCTCIYQQSPSEYFLFPRFHLQSKFMSWISFLYESLYFLNVRFSCSPKITTKGLQPNITHIHCYGFNFPLHFLE